MADLLLLAEDEIFVALDVQEIAEASGFAVDGPHGSLAATLAAMGSDPGRYRAAILDVRLADGEVFPAADRLRAAGVPIIFHSGHAAGGELTAHYPGATICAKPCQPQAIEAALAQARG